MHGAWAQLLSLSVNPSYAGYSPPSAEHPLGELAVVAGAFNPCNNFYGLAMDGVEVTIPVEFAEIQVGLTSIVVSAQAGIRVGKTSNIFSDLPETLWTPE